MILTGLLGVIVSRTERSAQEGRIFLVLGWFTETYKGLAVVSSQSSTSVSQVPKKEPEGLISLTR